MPIQSAVRHSRDGLVAFGFGLMRFLTSPDPVRFHSAMAGELSRHPDLARRNTFAKSPGTTLRDSAQPFTAPLAMPSMKRFCSTTKNTTTGAAIITAVAIMPGQSLV